MFRKTKLLVISLVFLVGLVCSHLTKESEVIYDLSSDPYEQTDLYGSETVKNSVVSAFQERREYWASLTVSSNSPDLSNRVSSWVDCGRVCEWNKEENNEIKSLKRLYSNSEAPNIVYVLVDDWGYNDLGKRSTYLQWTTPNIDRLSNEGILLENYYATDLCGPSRAALLTGRYPLRTGVYFNYDELPSSETTLAEELKTAGYRNYMIGKWHLGQSSKSLWPNQRGFDYFYGYLNAYETYWSKKYDNYIDLFENNEFVTDANALDESYHSAYLYQSKAEDVIRTHAESYGDMPMFLYYSMQLVHFPWTAPEEYLMRCTKDKSAFYDSDSHYSAEYAVYNYCGMNLMMDDAIANLTCTLEKYNMSSNTILIIAGDNGAEKTIRGGSYPYKGHKESVMRGGFATNALIHSPLIPESARGTTYNYDVHITDWLPTIMRLATNGQWKGSLSGAVIDGVDIWDGIVSGEPTSRTEMVLLSYSSGQFAMQMNSFKYIYSYDTVDGSLPDTIFEKDLDPKSHYSMCLESSLVNPSSSSWDLPEVIITKTAKNGQQPNHHGPPTDSNKHSSQETMSSEFNTVTDFADTSDSYSVGSVLVILVLLIVSIIIAITAFMLIMKTRSETRELEEQYLLQKQRLRYTDIVESRSSQLWQEK